MLNNSYLTVSEDFWNQSPASYSLPNSESTLSVVLCVFGCPDYPSIAAQSFKVVVMIGKVETKLKVLGLRFNV